MIDKGFAAVPIIGKVLIQVPFLYFHQVMDRFYAVGVRTRMRNELFKPRMIRLLPARKGVKQIKLLFEEIPLKQGAAAMRREIQVLMLPFKKYFIDAIGI